MEVSRQLLSRRLLVAGALGGGSLTLVPPVKSAAQALEPTADPLVAEARRIIPFEGAYFGAFVKHDPDRRPGLSEPEMLESITGKFLGINHSFQHWNTPFQHELLRADIALGRIPMLSWGAGPNSVLSQTANGKNDQIVRSQAEAMRALGAPILLRFTWEMDLIQRGYDPAVFKKAWRRVRDIFRDAGADNVAFVFCPTWLAYQTGRVSSFWPGDAYVDWIGADGYARPSNNYAPLTELFPWFYDFGLRHGHPMIICETGVHDGGSHVQANWLRQAKEDLQTHFPLISALVYFDSRGDGDTDWVIPGDPRAEAAVRQLANDPYFLPRSESNTVVDLALRAKVIASSVLSSNHAEHVCDGNRVTRWISAGSTDPVPTLEFRLESPSRLRDIIVESGTAGSEVLRVADFDVHVLSADGWQPAASVHGNVASPLKLRTRSTPRSVTGVRFTFTRPSPQDTMARVFRIQLLGVPN